MLTYHQSTGEIYIDDHYEGIGYSGKGNGRNNPEFESVAHVGPIPRGKYVIGTPYDSNKCGPMCFPLTPVGHDAFGRRDFRIHGDNRTHDASEGCVIMGRTLRAKIWGDEKLLEVI